MVEYANSENLPLARIHTEMVRFTSGDDDSLAFILETIEEKLSKLVPEQTQEGIHDLPVTRTPMNLLTWPQESGTYTVR